jgi:hypothetical protein
MSVSLATAAAKIASHKEGVLPVNRGMKINHTSSNSNKSNSNKSNSNDNNDEDNSDLDGADEDEEVSEPK